MRSTLSKFYTIQTWTNNEILRKKSKNVTKIDEDLINLWNDMIELMYEQDWVWLAAPQIGKNIRMIAVTSRKETKKWSELASETIMLNPVITEKSNETIIWKEACLSVPDITWYVKRHKNITVEYTSLDWHKKTKKLKDYNAVIIQHEVDHLDGILFTDKIEKNYKEPKNKKNK